MQLTAAIFVHSTENHSSTSAPVKIFYGLNESHSTSWAQAADNGTIGITYFRHDETDKPEGSLIYKTIKPDMAENEEIVSSGRRLENSVLLFDSISQPHIFAASSNNSDQIIVHFFKDSGLWQNDTIVHFYNEGGKFIYELSAESGPDGSFHLLVLKTRSNPDSDDYYLAFLDAYLYNLSNSSGSWQKELVHNYDTIWTLDEYSKALCRQDIAVDKNGCVHIVFGEQIDGLTASSIDRLQYASNKSGSWEMETAVQGPSSERTSAGWYPSLCLDDLNQPYISCAYIKRFNAGSARSAELRLYSRGTNSSWNYEVIADKDDGYYGGDGRRYTGALTHLVFDQNNDPHIIFSDIASSHAGNNYFNLGNIRHAVKKQSSWQMETIFRQPLPSAFYNAVEMYGMCLLIHEDTDRIHIIGQQLEINSENDYSCALVHRTISCSTNISQNRSLFDNYILRQNYPNPFNSKTAISYQLAAISHVDLSIYNNLGKKVQTLISKNQPAGNYTAEWDAAGFAGGVYFCRLKTGKRILTKKMVYVR